MEYFLNTSGCSNVFLALKNRCIGTYPEDYMIEQLLNWEEKCRTPHTVPALVQVLVVQPVSTSGSTKLFHKSLQNLYNLMKIIMVVEQTNEPPRLIFCLQQFANVSVDGINYLQVTKSWNSLTTFS